MNREQPSRRNAFIPSQGLTTRRALMLLPVFGLGAVVGLTIAGVFGTPWGRAPEGRAETPQAEVQVARRIVGIDLDSANNFVPAATDARPAVRTTAGVSYAPTATSESDTAAVKVAEPLPPPALPVVDAKPKPTVGMLATGPVTELRPSASHGEGGPEIPLLPGPDRGAESAGIANAVAHAPPPRPHAEATAHGTAAPAPREPWRLYAAAYDKGDTRPRIALVVGGLSDDMASAIDLLPPQVTLALDPYARHLPEWIELARDKGHEVLLTLSLPPLASRKQEDGPMAILSAVDARENLERLDWALGRTVGFVGVLDLAANRPAAEAKPILAALAGHGVMLVDGGPGPDTVVGLPQVSGDIVILPDNSRDGLERKLALLEDKARRDGHALGVVLTSQATVRRVASWTGSLGKKSFALVPATAFAADRQSGTLARQ